MYLVDVRTWHGNIYEVQYRSLTFYTSKYWIRAIPYEYMLAPNDPIRVEYMNQGDVVPQLGHHTEWVRCIRGLITLTI